jgi:hypothetical protein
MMHAVGRGAAHWQVTQIVRLFCSKSEQNAKWEGWSPSVPTTSLSAHTRTFFGLTSLSLYGHKWQQHEHQQELLFFCEFRIPDMIWMILVTQKIAPKSCRTGPNPRKDQRPLAAHESLPNRRTTNLVSRDALSYLW